MTSYFVKLMENSPLRDKMLRERPSAFCLLTLVVIRARKAEILDEYGAKIFDGIEIGEAMIGDFESYGATLQSYRTDKRYLQTHKILTYRTTNKGTIAKLINSSVFDISREKLPPANQQTKQQTINKPATTKQEGEKEEINSPASTELSVNDSENLQMIDSLTSEDISSVAHHFSISEKDVQGVLEELRRKVANGEFRVLIKDARKTLEQWVKKQIEWKKIHPEQTFEEIAKELTGDPNFKVY